MNERIRKIESQAWGQVKRTNGLVRTEDFNQKFAELIIKECANNLEVHSTCFDGDVSRGIKTAARLTKEHFGVE
jgi:hypothetical protein